MERLPVLLKPIIIPRAGVGVKKKQTKKKKTLGKEECGKKTMQKI